MPSTTYTNFNVTTSWQDIVANTSYSAINSADVTVQNISTGAIQVFFGGATAPNSSDGNVLLQYKSIRGSSDHIWVKGSGYLSITVE